PFVCSITHHRYLHTCPAVLAGIAGAEGCIVVTDTFHHIILGDLEHRSGQHQLVMHNMPFCTQFDVLGFLWLTVTNLTSIITTETAVATATAYVRFTAVDISRGAVGQINVGIPVDVKYHAHVAIPQGVGVAVLLTCGRITTD